MAEEKKKPVKELTVKKLREKGVKPKPEVVEMSKEQRRIIKQIKVEQHILEKEHQK